MQEDQNKRQKPGPSKVVHCRGLPAYATENELVTLAQPFGRVVRTLILNEKQQAFIQFESEENAANCVGYYDTKQAQIRSKNVYFQFSNRTEVKNNHSNQSNHAGSAVGVSGGDPPNHILLVSILNARFPVTVDNIHQCFSPIGTVQKIVTFTKNKVLKALVQMATIDQAVNAKYHLDEKDMFEGCCHLRIGFSNLTEINMKSNGPNSRDYTDFSVASGASAASQFGQFGSFASPQFAGMQQMNPYAQSPFMQQEQKCVLLVNNLPEQLTADDLFILFGCYGDVVRVKILYNKRDSAMIEFVSGEHAATALQNLNHFGLLGNELAIAVSKHSRVSPPQENDSEILTKDFTDSPVQRFRKAGSRKNINAPSPVLHLSNLHDNATEDELSELFSGVGTAVVQFFATNRKMAYVKMESSELAAMALMKFHNQQLAGRYLRISFSPKDPASITESESQEK